ncbi:uncharacterized protein BDZ99DRAFT_564696 [Mytilinidion resinicola]|uniref:Uncharacterized protein n=1 Tax=Mytilinidion resinicola TaxID=574789 RepID=A0A6A6Z6Z1_9PEZI|nr:uncharacterized protein BDZ99DRAFT_564696 [Mytilinidion resinicola]KAF2816872.1 hypothetical protein BDZ99DRAFT_564696 [Mytilinidion resinicola]
MPNRLRSSWPWWSLSASFQVPFEPVQVEGGDVVICLSQYASDMLILSSSVLRQIPWFDARLSSRWNPDDVEDYANLNTGEQMEIWLYDLNYCAEGNCWLLDYKWLPRINCLAFPFWFMERHLEAPKVLPLPRYQAQGLRHLRRGDTTHCGVGQPKEIPSPVVEAFGDVRAFKGLIFEKRESLYDLTSHLHIQLRDIGITKKQGRLSRWKAVPTVIPSLGPWTEDPDFDLKWMDTEHIARSVYTDWLSHNFSQSRLSYQNVSEHHESFKSTFSRIVEADNQKDTKMFTVRIKFEDFERVSPEEGLNWAHGLPMPTPIEPTIDHDFPPKARYDEIPYFTYAYVDEEDTPWYGKAPWKEVTWPKKGDWEPESLEWLEAMRIEPVFSADYLSGCELDLMFGLEDD